MPGRVGSSRGVTGHRALLPNLVIPGVAKAGTSSLFWYLGQHPDICPADRKEIPYFGPLRHGEAPRMSLDEYARHFQHSAGQAYRLDATPGYFDAGRRLVDAMGECLPEPKVLIALRDPTDRLWSGYLNSKARGELEATTTFRAFFDRSRELRASGRDRLPEFRPYRNLAIGCYSDVLPDWFDAFGDRIHIVFFEHLTDDLRRLMAGICGWLGIDTSPVEGFDYVVRNTTVQPRSVVLSNAARRINWRIDPSLRSQPRVKQALRSAYRVANASRRRERLSPQDRAAVEAFYAPGNRALGRELARRGYADLPPWAGHAP